MINLLIVTLMAILEDVFRNALKKKYGSDDNFDIT
jgi:N utilization substance protein A